jgi:hypothetical protein
MAKEGIATWPKSGMPAFHMAWAPLPGKGSPSWQVFPLNGGPPIPIGTFTILSWSLDGRSSFVSDISGDQTYIIPLAPGERGKQS